MNHMFLFNETLIKAQFRFDRFLYANYKLNAVLIYFKLRANVGPRLPYSLWIYSLENYTKIQNKI